LDKKEEGVQIYQHEKIRVEEVGLLFGLMVLLATLLLLLAVVLV